MRRLFECNLGADATQDSSRVARKKQLARDPGNWLT